MREEPIRKVKPITPKEIVKIRKEMIPDEVIVAANELIVKNWSLQSKKSYFKLDELVKLVLKKMPGMTDRQLYDDKLLDIESVFADYGWSVEYDSETPSFSFKVKKQETYNDYERDY